MPLAGVSRSVASHAAACSKRWLAVWRDSPFWSAAARNRGAVSFRVAGKPAPASQKDQRRAVSLPASSVPSPVAAAHRRARWFARPLPCRAASPRATGQPPPVAVPTRSASPATRVAIASAARRTADRVHHARPIRSSAARPGASAPAARPIRDATPILGPARAECSLSTGADRRILPQLWELHRRQTVRPLP